MDTTKVNRVEVIDHSKGGTGRDYVKWAKEREVKVELHLQDDGRTLKVFIEDTEGMATGF